MLNGPRGSQPSDCPDVTEADRALIRSVVGDTTEPRVQTKRAYACPRCFGRGRLDMAGVAQPMSVYFVRKTSQVCPRCTERGKVNTLSLDEVARQWSVAVDFADLVYDPGGIVTYRPSLDVRRPELAELAAAYDKVQEARGDARRVFAA